MVKSIKQWVADVIRNEKRNGKVFRTKEKTKFLSQMCGISKRYIYTLEKTPLWTLFQIEQKYIQ